jgi:hypothetical protein
VPNIVEIDDAASRLLDAQSTRRLIGLELADLDWEAAAASDAVLYFRIFATSDGNLTIELWDRGRRYGDRHISSQGNEPVRARRLALASVELARAAIRQQSVEQRRKRHRPRPVDVPSSSLQLPASLRLLPSARGSTVDFSDLTVAGPRLSAALVFQQGPRLDLGVGWQAGRVRAPADGTHDSGANARWSEIFLAPSYSWHWGDSEIDLGLQISAAAVSFQDFPVGPVERRSVHTWSSQLGLLTRYHHALSPSFRLFLELEAGHTLRPIAVWNPASNDQLAGFWAGLSLGGEITVLGRDRPPKTPR